MEPTQIVDTVTDWAEKAEALRVASATAQGGLPPVRQQYDPDAAAEEYALHDRQGRLVRQWSDIPARFSDATAADLGGELASLCNRWVASGMTSNVLLLGNVGAGKTHAAVAMLRSAAEAGLTIRFAPVVELLDQLRPGSPGSGDIERAIRPDVLVLDDLGGEKPTDWTAERLYAVINRRWLEQRPTIATSNLEPEALEEAIGSRTWSRLFHGALRLKLAGEDRRRAA